MANAKRDATMIKRKRMPGRRAAIAAALLSLATDCVHAQTTIERQLKALPGRDLRVGVFTSIRADCTSGPLPAIRLAVPAAHGTVTVKRATFKATNFKQCLATEVPAYVAFYRAAPDFTGEDAFDLEISYGAVRKQLQHIRVVVSRDASGGQGI